MVNIDDLKKFLENARKDGTDCAAIESKLIATEFLLCDILSIKEELEQMYKVCSKPKKIENTSEYGV